MLLSDSPLPKSIVLLLCYTTGSIPSTGRKSFTTDREDRNLIRGSLKNRRKTSSDLAAEVSVEIKRPICPRNTRRRLQEAGLKGCKAKINHGPQKTKRRRRMNCLKIPVSPMKFGQISCDQTSQTLKWVSQFYVVIVITVSRSQSTPGYRSRPICAISTWSQVRSFSGLHSHSTLIPEERNHSGALSGTLRTVPIKKFVA